MQPPTSELVPTGVLRAAINLGNPLLAQGTPDDPRGVSVDLAAEIGRRLGVAVETQCSTAARTSFEALVEGRVDVAFLAVEPARAEQVAFTEAYAVIEGVYVVPDGSPFETADHVDRDGVRIGVKEGSAYDLYLTRTLAHATVVRGAEGVDVFADEGLEVGAGIRQPATAYAGAHGLRVLEPAFVQIHQAVAVPRDRSQDAVTWLADLVEELKADGFVADALHRSGRDVEVPR